MLEGIEVARLIVRLPGDPAVMKCADPFVGERTQGRVSRCAFAARRRRQPRRAGDGKGGPFDEGLTKEGRAL